MYPPFPEDARLGELERQLEPPTGLVRRLVAVADPGQLPPWLRVGLVVAAVVLLLVGVAGLFLPGLQGILTILAGVAMLSLVSSRADRFLRWSLGPWPKILARVERLREGMFARLLRLVDRFRSGDCHPPGSAARVRRLR